MRTSTQHWIELCGNRVEYDIVASKVAQQIRVRVGPHGVEIIQPVGVSDEDVCKFLCRNEAWVLAQLDRVSRLRALRRPARCQHGEILFRGEPTPVRVEPVETKAQGNLVRWRDGEIVVRRGAETQTPAARGLENWLRRQARARIGDYLPGLTKRVGRCPGRVYVMGQRTKWGNCSSRGNLSFNWRLVLAPDFVLQYLVAHEVAHLVVPDHSAKFWLTVQSLCPMTERAKQWLSRHHPSLTVDLASVLEPADPID